MPTARTIVKKAMQKVGALRKSESPSADEASDGLDALNDMLDSWSNDSLTIYARTWETFTLTGSDSEYSIGTGGDFNTTRPTNIVTAYTRSGTTDYPMSIIDSETYNRIATKTAQGIPEFLNYDNAFPLGNIRIYPTPSSAYSMFLLTEKPLTTFTSLDTSLSMPPGTSRALIYNLALEIAPEYEIEVTPLVLKAASGSLGLIRSAITRVRGMDAFSSKVSTGNIYAGWYNRG